MKIQKHTKPAVLLSALILLAVVLTACIMDTTRGSYGIGNEELTFGIEPIPHVGAAHKTQRIISAMPLPSDDMTYRSIQIGADHGGFGYGAYTLTIHYDWHGVNLEDISSSEFEQIAENIFDFIENLQAVTFSLVSYEEADTDNYIFRWSISRVSSDVGGGALTSFRGLPPYL